MLRNLFRRQDGPSFVDYTIIVILTVVAVVGFVWLLQSQNDGSIFSNIKNNLSCTSSVSC